MTASTASLRSSAGVISTRSSRSEVGLVV
jgi:hypothetical protein